MILFATATLTPAALIALAALWGGAWPALALGYMTVLVFALDRLVAHSIDNADPEAEFPGAQSLLVTLGLGHFALLGLSLWAVGGHAGLGTASQVMLGIAAGLVFGQIGHPVAHELIHRPSRALRLLGRLIYTSLLVGHHASAHLRVHHVHVASDGDPSTARLGEGFYRFVLRAGIGAFRAGFRAESDLLRRGGKSWLSHPYILYVGGGLAFVLVAYVLAGAGGVAAYLAMCVYAQMQILMSDYVQHYGLRRKTRPDGRLEPVGPRHSWNAPHWYSAALTLNAPRHSDHHVTPLRSYPALQLVPDQMPFLPYPLPMMAALSLVPVLWRLVMDHRARQWRDVGG
ncbi:alkane 1-monooxygenase [Rhodobacteraceae bacterium KMM 6894]|nr:alkane 1-monooxygenase [Rhodobacteraceae bacterium KMM 6894]